MMTAESTKSIKLGVLNDRMAIMLTLDMTKEGVKFAIAKPTWDDYVVKCREFLKESEAKYKVEVRVIYEDRIEERTFEEAESLVTFI